MASRRAKQNGARKSSGKTAGTSSGKSTQASRDSKHAAGGRRSDVKQHLGKIPAKTKSVSSSKTRSVSRTKQQPESSKTLSTIQRVASRLFAIARGTKESAVSNKTSTKAPKSSGKTKVTARKEDSRTPKTAKAAALKTDRAPTKAAATPVKTKAARPKDEAPKAAAASTHAAGQTLAESAHKRVSALRGAQKQLLPRQFLFDLAQTIKDAIHPLLAAGRGKEIVSTAQSGDATFELDRVAERALMNFLRNARMPIAYYSEDTGYSTFAGSAPKHLLIVDPIDGTRAAKSGFEGCVIAIATTDVIERPCMADVDSACVMEIFGDRVFYAERGKGARIYTEGHVKKPKLSENNNLELMTWAMTVPARPAELIFPTAARLIDLTSLKGGFFACNSTSYSLTRLLTGQLDACIDIASRYMQDIPSVVRDQFINAGRGRVMGIAPYDLAASLLITQEAGCKVTNAYGKGFDDVLLLDSSEANHQSLIAAANIELYEKLFNFFDMRIRQFEELLRRRAEINR